MYNKNVIINIFCIIGCCNKGVKFEAVPNILFTPCVFTLSDCAP